MSKKKAKHEKLPDTLGPSPTVTAITKREDKAKPPEDAEGKPLPDPVVEFELTGYGAKVNGVEYPAGKYRLPKSQFDALYGVFRYCLKE